MQMLFMFVYVYISTNRYVSNSDVGDLKKKGPWFFN